MTIVLHDYWRSSAAYRVRIALNLKGVAYESRPVNLVEGEQCGTANRARNPQGLVPTLEADGVAITQSLAIIDWLEATHPEPRLIPVDPMQRAQAMARALVVVADIHPIDNLRVLKRLEAQFGANEEQRAEWSRYWIGTGFRAIEVMLGDNVATGRYCHGETPSMADACLIPQVYNALRCKLPMDDYPTISRIYRSCNELEAFQRAAPEAQPDAPQS